MIVQNHSGMPYHQCAGVSRCAFLSVPVAQYNLDRLVTRVYINIERVWRVWNAV